MAAQEIRRQSSVPVLSPLSSPPPCTPADLPKGCPSLDPSATCPDDSEPVRCSQSRFSAKASAPERTSSAAGRPYRAAAYSIRFHSEPENRTEHSVWRGLPWFRLGRLLASGSCRSLRLNGTAPWWLLWGCARWPRSGTGGACFPFPFPTLPRDWGGNRLWVTPRGARSTPPRGTASARRPRRLPPDRGPLAYLAQRERCFGFGEDLDDALPGAFRLRDRLSHDHQAKPQGGPLAVVGEFDLDSVDLGRGAVLDGHVDLPVADGATQRSPRCMHSRTSARDNLMKMLRMPGRRLQFRRVGHEVSPCRSPLAAYGRRLRACWRSCATGGSATQRTCEKGCRPPVSG